jgi:hypothetical protein
VLFAFQVPALQYLDVMAPGLCIFLAGGRAGCLMVGCCHGHPCRTGLRYGKAHADEGFPEYLVNVRLFPVQAIEFAGLLIISALCAPFIVWGREGTSLAWFLFAYAVLRFATEGLRADERPGWGGMSWPRIMSLMQIVFAIFIVERRPDLVVWIVLLAAAASALLTWLRYDWTRRALSRRHVEELRRIAGAHSGAQDPVSATTSEGVSVVVSGWPHDEACLHVSVRLRDRKDVGVACRLAAAVFPHLDASRAEYTDEHTIHVVVPRVAPEQAGSSDGASRRLYESFLRRYAETEQPTELPAPRHRERPWFWRQSA